MPRLAPPTRGVLFTLLGLGLAALPGLVPEAPAGDWKGVESKEDGILLVQNPAEPMNGTLKVDLSELWKIGGYSDDPDEFFGVISRIITDEEGNVYLLDSQLSEIKIFSPDGEFLNTIGREGEGPGEFRRPSDAFFVPDGNIGVLQPFPSKIVLLTRDGEPAGEYPLGATEGFRILQRAMPGKDRLYLHDFVQVLAENRADLNFRLTAVDGKGEVIQEYLKETRVFEMANPVIDETKYDTFDRRWLAGPEGRLFAGTTHAEYRIQVWNPDGTVDRIITREFTPRERSAKEKEVVHGVYEAFTRQAPGAQLKINDHDPNLMNLYVRDDGSLWVMTSRGLYDNPEGSIGVFDVFDRRGRYVSEVTLMGDGDPENDGYFFVGDRIYVVTDFLQAAMALQGGGTDATLGEKEAEPMAVVCFRLDVPDFGSPSEE